jgi:hypothetical protein
MRQAIHDFITSSVIPTTRRSFLRTSATLAAVGAASGVSVAFVLPESAAGAPPSHPDDAFISPQLFEMADEIDTTFYAWIECCEDCNMRDRALRAWEKRNPTPVFLMPDDEGYSPTARSDWHMRRQSVMRQLRLGDVKGERNKLGKIYNDAVRLFSEHKPSTAKELLLKVSFGSSVDNSDCLIAKSVLRDIRGFTPRLFQSGVAA